MKAKIMNFRLGRHNKSENHMIVTVEGVDKREKALGLVGKKVTWISETGTKINGTVASAHGNKGAVRVIFEKGMPGQAISAEVELN